LHLSRKGIGDFVVHRLNQVTEMHCQLVVDGGDIKPDIVYIARPNQHMLVKDNKFVLGGGPEENRFRPSIDVLFRSAAVAFSSHAIGIILSGMLDDGTSGMSAIKRSGGTCVVQDPNEAEYPDMPLSVINNLDVDYVVTLHEIGSLIATITRLKTGRKQAVPKDVIAESKIAETTAVGIAEVEKIGKISVFACPDCGGNLWSMEDDIIKRYRCHIGHAYTEKDLVIKQAETASTTLWVAVRMMEERKHLLKKIEKESLGKGHKQLASHQSQRHDDMERHINHLKKMLFDLQCYDTT
ncbi:MAG: chemotaxis protein CheB, partial [Bacteroidota bacterium]|nr:chemotaxis protein CheB [Bacteroidota bacterium]